MRAVRAVICDLDGTLVRTGNVVLDEDVEMLREVRGCGVRTTLITGRPSRALSDVPAGLLSLFTTVFTSNGASVVTDGRVQIIAPLDPGQGLEFATALRAADPTVAFATEFETTFGYEQGYAWWPATDTDPGAVCADIGDLFHLGRPATRLLCRSGTRSAAELARTAESIDFRLTVTYSCRPDEGGPVEVLAPHASKGRAARQDLRRVNVDPLEAVAFGDRHNDLSMLSAVALVVAIGDDTDPRLAAFPSARSVGRWLAEHRDSWCPRDDGRHDRPARDAATTAPGPEQCS